MEQRVAPGLLLAMPQLPDPNFARSVVLMIQHDEQTSLGLVVNRPLDLSLDHVMRSLDLDWKGAEQSEVFCGGPVTPQSGWLLHGHVGLREAEPSLEVAPGIWLSTTPDQLRALAASPPEPMRFLLGYAGWGPSQLEFELAQGAWLIAPASPELVFHTPPHEMWVAAIRSLGIEPATLIPASGVH